MRSGASGFWRRDAKGQNSTTSPSRGVLLTTWGQNVLTGAAAERRDVVMATELLIIHPQAFLQAERAFVATRMLRHSGVTCVFLEFVATLWCNMCFLSLSLSLSLSLAAGRVRVSPSSLQLLLVSFIVWSAGVSVNRSW